MSPIRATQLFQARKEKIPSLPLPIHPSLHELSVLGNPVPALPARAAQAGVVDLSLSLPALEAV